MADGLRTCGQGTAKAEVERVLQYVRTPCITHDSHSVSRSHRREPKLAGTFQKSDRVTTGSRCGERPQCEAEGVLQYVRPPRVKKPT
jgi:hypothetical protein